MMPVVASTASQGAAWKAPCRMANSPMNPFRPGRPMLLMVMIMKMVA